MCLHKKFKRIPKTLTGKAYVVVINAHGDGKRPMYTPHYAENYLPRKWYIIHPHTMETSAATGDMSWYKAGFHMWEKLEDALYAVQVRLFNSRQHRYEIWECEYAAVLAYGTNRLAFQNHKTGHCVVAAKRRLTRLVKSVRVDNTAKFLPKEKK